MYETSPQPANRTGTKQVDCPFYEHCQTLAARRNWKAWSCEQCPCSKLQAVFQRIRYIEPYYGVLADIYPEFKASYDAVMSSFSMSTLRKQSEVIEVQRAG
jgi:hypothetical protein